MPLIRKEDVMPERPVIIVLYGTPGSGKTSLAMTSSRPLLIDTDRGFDRACYRVDTITASHWEDIFNREVIGYSAVKDGQQVFVPGLVKDYDTVIVDTAKAMIDDYLSAYVIQCNYKLATNSLKKFGEMGDKFKEFVNLLRTYGKDLVFICHDKETQEGDIIRHFPDCTGQSRDLLVRIADQVGYLCKENGLRVIHFEPTDTRVGKNVAQLADHIVPDYGDESFLETMANIINKVKSSISSRGEAQMEALCRLGEARKLLAVVATVEQANSLMETANGLAPIHQKGFKKQMIENLKSKGIVFDNETKQFVAAS